MIAKNSDSEGIPTLKSYLVNLQQEEKIQQMYDTSIEDAQYLIDVAEIDKSIPGPVPDATDAPAPRVGDGQKTSGEELDKKPSIAPDPNIPDPNRYTMGNKEKLLSDANAAKAAITEKYAPVLTEADTMMKSAIPSTVQKGVDQYTNASNKMAVEKSAINQKLQKDLQSFI